MGLFCINNEKVKTVEGSIEVVLENIRIYKNSKTDLDYLKAFIDKHLEEAVAAAKDGKYVKLEDNTYSW